MDKNDNVANLNLYHTNLRNVGLFFTLSIGIITLSSNKIIKDPIINLLFDIIGICLLFLSYKLVKSLDEIKEGITQTLINVKNIMKNIILLLLIIMIYSLVISKLL